MSGEDTRVETGTGEESPHRTSEAPEGADSLITGFMEMLNRSPELRGLAESLTKADLSPLIGLIRNMDASPTPAPADGADRATALLSALRPFLNQPRGDQVDRTLKMLSTAQTMRTAIRAFNSMTGDAKSV